MVEPPAVAMKRWSLEDIDLSKAIDVIPAQDPETALRYSLPVPNWLDEHGEPCVSHPQIRTDQKGGWRFFFYNDKDSCWQDVRVDGSSCITFMGPKPDQAKTLTRRVLSLSPDPEKTTPEQLAALLAYAKNELGLKDVYDNRCASVLRNMHAWPAPDEAHPALGAFLPNPQLSAAVYLPGAGEFLDGPTATPQRFANGAFISFPGQPREKIAAMTPAELRGTKSLTIKLVQRDVFVDSRTYVDGSKIDPTHLLVQAAAPERAPRLPPALGL